MKKCKIKPLRIRCNKCLDMQMRNEKYLSCVKCEMENIQEAELIQIVPDFFGRLFAVVLIDGECKQVAISRVFDVREVRA